MSSVSRRSLLHRLGLFFGALAGGLIPSSSLAVLDRTDSTPSYPASLSLVGRDWHLHSSDRVRGELPRRGDRLSMYGELAESDEGPEVGQFFSACFCPDSPGQSGLFAGTALEMHTFNLKGGTIMGVGVAGLTPEQAGQFAIVGGTGRFAGARGHYTARQEPVELAGSGTAEFRFTFIS